jgi:hypothetical protein
MKKDLIINFIFILLLLLVSCNIGSQKKKIEVVYFTGNPEFPIHISEKDIKQLNCDTSETISISRADFEFIIDGLQNKKIINDSRKITPLIYLKLDTLERFFGDSNYITNINGNKYKTDDYFLYFIRCKIGYYNYLDKEDLLYRIEIKKFGIPKDYRYKLSDRNKPKKEINKVILILRD